MQVTQNPIQVTDPGGPNGKGFFTKYYLGGVALRQGVLKQSFEGLEEDLGRYAMKSYATFKRARNKSLLSRAIADAEQGESRAMGAKSFGDRSQAI